MILEHADLVDIPLGRLCFSWSDRWGSKFCKLDRFLITEGLFHNFPHMMGLVLAKNLPDHRPIILIDHHVDYGPTPFQIFHSWFE